MYGFHSLQLRDLGRISKGIGRSVIWDCGCSVYIVQRIGRKKYGRCSVLEAYSRLRFSQHPDRTLSSQVRTELSTMIRATRRIKPKRSPYVCGGKRPSVLQRSNAPASILPQVSDPPPFRTALHHLSVLPAHPPSSSRPTKPNRSLHRRQKAHVKRTTAVGGLTSSDIPSDDPQSSIAMRGPACAGKDLPRSP